MSKSEFSNMYKMILVLIVEMFVVMFGLSRVALYTSAGDLNYQLSLVFVIAQTVAIIKEYVSWYRRVNKNVAEMYNIEEKRSTAFHDIPRYFFAAIAITGLIALCAAGAMFFQVLFVGIEKMYCFTSVLSEFFVGNITLLIMMRFLGLPDRVLGRY